MKFIRIYSGEDKKSHFETLDAELYSSTIGKISSPIFVDQLFFGEIEDEQEISWHNPPCSQYVIMLQGAMEIETGNQDKRVFNIGDILLAEDITGEGHITRAASNGIRKYMVITLK